MAQLDANRLVFAYLKQCSAPFGEHKATVWGLTAKGFNITFEAHYLPSQREVPTQIRRKPEERAKWENENVKRQKQEIQRKAKNFEKEVGNASALVVKHYHDLGKLVPEPTRGRCSAEVTSMGFMAECSETVRFVASWTSIREPEDTRDYAPTQQSTQSALKKMLPGWKVEFSRVAPR